MSTISLVSVFTVAMGFDYKGKLAISGKMSRTNELSSDFRQNSQKVIRI